MMYSENKKVNKTLLIIISCLLFISSILCINPYWLTKYYDDTLCVVQGSSSSVVFDESYLDYTDSNFISKFDFALNVINNYSGSFALSSVTYYYSITALNGFSTSWPDATNQSSASSNHFYYYGSETPGTSSQVSLALNYYTGSFSTIYFAKYPNGVGNSKIDVVGLNYTNFTYAYNMTYYDFVFAFDDGTNTYIGMSNGLYQKYLAYMVGFNSADVGSAFTDGQNSVINNPNQFGLYTQEQYNNNYTDGQNSVINNPNSYGLFTQAQLDSASNSAYLDGATVGYTNGINAVRNNPNQYGLYTQEQLDAEYNRGYQIGQDDIDANPNSYGYYTQSQYNNNYTNGQNSVINNPSEFGLYTYEDFIDNYETGYADGILNVTNSPNAYGLYSKSDIDNAFSNGYIAGYDVGYDVGESDAINRTDAYNFNTLISSVVDAPINMFKSMFNFEVFGINLFSFFTSLFTLCLVVFIATRLLKR